MGVYMDERMMMENGEQRIPAKRPRVETGPSTSAGWTT